ncbi:MAG TPA: hypothetical protein VJS92_04350 [Candidatus Polarisedimenticolaceae bacterium]|nr:hypothetical protein [Candidatus Polarisedimenticolaceae bacterium]
MTLPAAVLLLGLLQANPNPPSTIVSRPSEPPRRNFVVIYDDDAFLFAARDYGDSRDRGGNTEPGLFVHSKAESRWIRIEAISTVGGRFGKSESDDPQARQQLSRAQVGWDFTRYAQLPYIEQPLHTMGSIAFPDRIGYDAATGRYELWYFSSWGIPSAETVLCLDRADLVRAFVAR